MTVVWDSERAVDVPGIVNVNRGSWLNFSQDADVIHPPDTLGRLVAKAENDDLALVSLMVRLPCESFWERLLVPAFIFFFQMLYPFRAINDRSNIIAGAAGGCILLKSRSLEEAGGLAAMKDHLIDDCALARIVKQNGNGIWLGLAEGSRSLRRYMELSEFWHMVARSAFVQLRHSTGLLAASLCGMVITFVAPPLIVVGYPLHGDTPAAGLAAAVWVAIIVAYRPCLRYHGLNPAYGIALPLASLLYLGMTVHSAVRHWVGMGPDWKNRSYAPK